jgi:5'-nucleotidase
MKILVSNDDGFQAKGIVTLVKALSTIAEVTVVAPDRNRSGASNSLTLDAPLRVQQADNGFYYVNGTPTDCVHLAITGLLEQEPDMVIAGINAGANLGDDVLYSGTVAAATEGRFMGLPAIAVSLVGQECEHYETAAQVVLNLIKNMQDRPLPPDTLLNVNVPDLSFDAIAGIEVTRLGNRHKSEPTIKAKDPRGFPIYWVGPAGPEQDAGPGTDFYAIRNRYVSVTPISVDLTQYNALDQLSVWMRAGNEKL